MYYREVVSSNMSKLYDVVITGNFFDGFDPTSVELEFAELFKLEAEKAKSFFSGRKRRIKKSVDHITASKYKSRIERLGAVVEISSSQLESKGSASVERSQKTIENQGTPSSVTNKSVTTEAQNQIKNQAAKAREHLNSELRASAVNAIDFGRKKQARKMQMIEIDDERSNTWLMVFGILCIIFALADLGFEYFNVISISGVIWVPITALIVGCAFFSSSTQN